MTFQEAAGTGLIDEIHPLETLEEKAVEKVLELGAYEAGAFASIKASRVGPVQAEYRAVFREKNEAFLDCWFSEPVRAKLEAAAEKF